MAEIIEKTWKPDLMVDRPVFKGYPNLFTADDMNMLTNQVYERLNIIEGLVGVQSDINVTSCKGSSGKMTLTISGTSLIVRGSDFKEVFNGGKTFSCGSLLQGDKVFLYLLATSELLTYENDPTGDLAVAKFSNGTSKPAAEYKVFKNPKLELSKKCSDENKCIATIGFGEYSEGDCVFFPNTSPNSLPMWCSFLENKEPEVITEQELSTTLTF